MSRWLRGVVPALMLMTWLGAGLTDAQERATVTVRRLFDLGHRIEVSAGGEVVWADPHFGRVWFRRAPGTRPWSASRAAFGRCSPRRGPTEVRSRLWGGHGTNDVYNVTVVVKPRS